MLLKAATFRKATSHFDQTGKLKYTVTNSLIRRKAAGLEKNSEKLLHAMES